MYLWDWEVKRFFRADCVKESGGDNHKKTLSKGISVSSFVLLAKLALTVSTLFPRCVLSTYCRPGTWLQIFMPRNNHDSPVLYFSVSRETSKCVQKFTSRSYYSNELRRNRLKIKSLQLPLKPLTGLGKLKFPNLPVRKINLAVSGVMK